MIAWRALTHIITSCSLCRKVRPEAPEAVSELASYRGAHNGSNSPRYSLKTGFVAELVQVSGECYDVRRC